jgi:hypothetical protein
MADEHPVKQYFAIDTVANTSTCMIDETCKKHEKPMKGSHSGNLTRHLKRYHPAHLEELEKKLGGRKRKRGERNVSVK